MRLGILLGGLVLIGFRAFAANAPAEPAPVDKSDFTLWRPTPREAMREMSTDRPDRTESAYTVDAGHFQVEADILKYSYDRYNSSRDHSRVETVGIAAMNLKVGLCNSTDFQLVVPTYNSVRTRSVRLFPTPAGGTARVNRETTERGFGDIQTRLKWNLWGNDGGETAFALMPYVKFPTASGSLGNDAFEGGLIAPFAVALPAGWNMGLMTQMDVNEDGDGSGHHAEWINSITFSHTICGDLSGYVEFFSLLNGDEHSEWEGTVDVGLTYGLTEDIQLDAGINIGVTRSADDFNPFLGISWRF
jgi:hypothetical protein